MTGSAVATFCAQILGNSYLWYAMGKLNPFHIAKHIRKIVVASIFMAAITALLMVTHVNVVLNVAISAVIYCLTLLFLKEPFLREIKSVLWPTEDVS
jgi:peptidoglycan biosynthesis protein MviN/MurJ (putative lipid II flippase)